MGSTALGSRKMGLEMKWFGLDWRAPGLKELEKVPVPIGESCFHCECSINKHDRGFVLPFASAEGNKETFWHFVCFKKAILG